MAKYNWNNKHLNVADFQHPSDRRAVNAVLAIPAFEKLLNFLSGNSIERVYSFINNSSKLKITKEMSPKIHEMLEEAAQMYGVDSVPEIYLNRTYAYFINLDGMDKPYVELPTVLLENENDEMLWAILSAQIAGIQARHGMLEFVGNLLGELRRFGMLPFAVDTALDLALKEWHRSRAYTVDRAILMATGSFEKAAKYILMGDAPREALDSMDLGTPGNPYYQQAQEFLRHSGVKGAIQKMETVFSASQWTASRYVELYNWYFSGEYHDVLEGCVDV